MTVANQVGKRASADGASGTLAGRYRLLRRVGQGGQAEVYLADDLTAGDRCAVKLYAASSERETARLLAEFARLAELGHRGVVRVRDLGRTRDQDRPYLVTDFVAGPALLDTGLPGAEDLAAVAADLADALAYLHGRGIAHGDVSAANVRLDESGRAVLLDFGLAAVAGRGAGASGTLGYLSPESLVGERGPLADLYGLGAVLYAHWTGAPPFGLGLEAVRRAHEGPPPAPSAVRPGLPPFWDALLLRLLASAPEDRPPSAREVLRELQRQRGGDVVLDLAAPQPEGDPLAGLFVGRHAERVELRQLLERLADGAAPVPVVAVCGPPGAGRHALVARALREARIAVVAGALADFDVEERAPIVDDGGQRSDDPGRAAAARRLRIAEALEARPRPLCLVIGPGPDDEALAAAIAGAEPTGRLLVLLIAESPPRHPRIRGLALGPLADRELVELITRASGTTATVELGARLGRASGGWPALAALIVRRAIAGLRQGGPAAQLALDGALLAGTPSLAAQLDAAFGALAPELRRAVASVALGLPVEHSGAAVAAGWLRATGGELAIGSPAHEAAVLRALATPALRVVAEAAARALPAGDGRLGEVLVALGEPSRAAVAFVEAARAAHRAGLSAAAARGWGRAAALDPEALGETDRLELAAALGVLGRYDDALAALGPVARPRAAERRAWILGRRGELAAARSELESALAEAPASILQARLARVLIGLGQLEEAATLAAAVPADGTVAAAIAREAGVLALAHAGKLDQAEALLASSPGPAARTRFLEGLCAQLAGRPLAAAAAYRASAQAHAGLGDPHGTAAATFNLGCVLAETGDYREALESFERAVRELGRLGAEADLVQALFNSGVLFLAVGDLGAAARAARQVRDEARGQSLPGAYADCLEGDLHRRQRAPLAASPLYARAAQALEASGNTVVADLTRLAAAEALAEAGRADQALSALQTVEERWGAQGPEPVREGLALTRGRLALRGPTTDGDLALAETLAALAGAAAQAGRRPAAWRAAQLAARLFARRHDPRASDQRDLARKIFEEVKMSTPVELRSGLDADPDQDRVPAGALSERAARAEGRLRRLLRINKRLNSELRLGRILETIVDTVIELTDAERGFLLLKDGAGELQVKVARNIEEGSLDTPELALSRSIARQAAERGEPVITVDATGDDRFREALSVTDLRLRSVLAVPLAVKGKVVGTIYVDHRLRKGVFDEDDVALVLDFAEQGAIAIENARLLAEVRKRERQVETLNQRLERELRARHVELKEVRQELEASREVAALRYDYKQIVGRTPRMLELFRLLDRVTDTSLPVVIQGESGTGKELVARAIHFNGPRRERAFVTENCAAIPETLLESTLFGYVKGAFTGADRDTRGLFAVADGGTLFLDEVAEMSPGMQGKLLRVLQDGELRRVGGERPQRVNVRVVVATNKDLARMVSEGKFRQDLFFRLSVVRLTLPPLRERPDDVPLLVTAFLKRHADAEGNSPRTVEPAAMGRLSAYRWPGNVRELENEVLRAAAFSSGTITVRDLSPQVASEESGTEPGDGSPDSLLLRPRVERLERSLIREALEASGGNQTRAAESLGLSRFGLQKKLRRYGIAS